MTLPNDPNGMSLEEFRHEREAMQLGYPGSNMTSMTPEQWTENAVQHLGYTSYEAYIESKAGASLEDGGKDWPMPEDYPDWYENGFYVGPPKTSIYHPRNWSQPKPPPFKADDEDKTWLGSLAEEREKND